MKTKMDYVRQFRRVSDASNLEKLVVHISRKLSGDEFYIMVAAADHRRAEMIMNRYYDKIPKFVWRYVR